MTKKHFTAVAEMIADIDDIDTKVKMANWFCNFFKKYSKTFNVEKFLSACGIYHYIPEENYLFESPEKTIKRIKEEF